MAKRGHILVVDDTGTSFDTIREYLADQGYDVSHSEPASFLLNAVSEQGVDVVLLDVDGVPNRLEPLTQGLYENPDVGIIIITGESDVIDMIVNFEVEADDFVTKPFHFREILIRVRRVLERTKAHGDKNYLGPLQRTQYWNGQIFKFGPWAYSPSSRQIETAEGESARFTEAENKLLAILVSNANRIMSREDLLKYTMDRPWTPDDRTIDTLIRRLRKKIEATPHDPQFIRTARNAGYVFVNMNHDKPASKIDHR